MVIIDPLLVVCFVLTAAVTIHCMLKVKDGRKLMQEPKTKQKSNP